VAVAALFESDGWGGPEEEPRVSEVWEAIEAVVSRADLRAALALVNENVPPADAVGPDDWRAELLGRCSTVSRFLKLLPHVISFGANAEGAAVLGGDAGAGRRAGLPQPPARAVDPRPPGRRRRGERAVVAPGVRPPGACGRRGEPARLR
jgi:hypothetical protein